MSKAIEISELKDLTKYRLDEINKIKDYLNSEIKERKDIIKKISKYIVAFVYADKRFITLSASFGTLSIASYATVVGIPVGIAGASLTLIFTITTGVVKTLLNITRKKKKKHNDDIVDEYNNTYHTRIKMKPADVKDNTYINTDKEINNKGPRFKVGDHVRISKYKNIFAKGYMPNWSEEVFVIKKVKNTVPWNYVINDLNGEEIIGTFYEKELQKTSQEEFRIEKVIRRKGDKLYVKWKSYDNSFNSWIDKASLVQRT